MAGFSKEWMLNESFRDHDVRQVVMTDAVWAWFVEFVYSRGLDLFPIPDAAGGFDYEDDLPAYGVGPGDKMREEWASGR
jgi:hypothetical protein